MLQNNMCDRKHPFDCIVGDGGDGGGAEPPPHPNPHLPPCQVRQPDCWGRSGGRPGAGPTEAASFPDISQQECGKTEEHTRGPCSTPVNHTVHKTTHSQGAGQQGGRAERRSNWGPPRGSTGQLQQQEEQEKEEVQSGPEVHLNLVSLNFTVKTCLTVK